LRSTSSLNFSLKAISTSSLNVCTLSVESRNPYELPLIEGLYFALKVDSNTTAISTSLSVLTLVLLAYEPLTKIFTFLLFVSLLISNEYEYVLGNIFSIFFPSSLNPRFFNASLTISIAFLHFWSSVLLKGAANNFSLSSENFILYTFSPY